MLQASPSLLVMSGEKTDSITRVKEGTRVKLCTNSTQPFLGGNAVKETATA